MFKKLQTQDIHFTPVNSPSATDTKLDLPVNVYSHWKCISLQRTGLWYCVVWLEKEFWRYLKVPLLS